MRAGIDAGKNLLRHAVGAAVAVAHRVAQQVALLVNQPEIHPPGVNTDALDAVALVDGHTDSPLHILKQRKEIPVNASAHAHLPVGKAVDGFQLEPSFGGVAGDYTPATTPEIYGEIYFFHLVFFPNTYVSRSSISAGERVSYRPPERIMMRQAISKNMARSKAWSKSFPHTT